MTLSSLVDALARAQKARDTLDPLGAMVRRAKSLASALKVAPQAQPGGAPDPTSESLSGGLTTDAFAQGGTLPSGAGVPRRRRRLAGEQTSKAERASAKADAAPPALDQPVPDAFPGVPVVEVDAIEEPQVTIFAGLPIVIDRPAGFTQVKLTPEGDRVWWTRTYSTNYGYLPGTCGGDCEELDCFVGPDTSSEEVWWFCIQDCAGVFDEYKLVFGVMGEAAARAIILAHIPEKFVAPGSWCGTLGQVKALLGKDPIERTLALDLVSKALDRTERMQKSLKSVAAFLSKAPDQTMVEAPADFNHPAVTAPLSGTYPDPKAVGGWLGWIEPNETEQAPRAPAVEVGAGRYSETGFGDWIAFVGVDGRTLLWTERDEDGGVVGMPMVFMRPDLAPKLTDKERNGYAAESVMAEKSYTVKMVQVGKAASPEEQYIFGVVLTPEETDLQGEVYAADVIRRSAHDWAGYCRNFDAQHKIFINDKMTLAETYTAPVDFAITLDGETYKPEEAPQGAEFVKKGSWLLGAYVRDPELWTACKRGEFTGWSINGLSRKEDL